MFVKMNTKMKLFALGSSSLIMILANTMLFPIFPQMRKALDLGLRDISLMVLFVSLPAAFLNPIAGYLADIWGRKKIMVPSILLYGLAGGLIGVIIFLLEQPFYYILALRLLQGIGSASPMYLAVALGGDIFQNQEERTRAMGFIETSNGLGKVSSPVIGGALGLIGWYAPFFLYPLVAIPVALLLSFSIQEPPLKEKTSLRSELASLQKLFSLTNFLALMTGFAAIFTLYGTMFWLGEFLEKTIPDGTIIHGLIISIPVAALIITALFASWISTRLGPRITLSSGLFLSGASLASIPWVHNTPLLWPALVLLGVSTGLLLPVIDTISTAVATRGHRGIIAGFFGSFRCLGAAAASFLIAVLLDISLIVSFVFSAGLVIAVGLGVFLFAREKEMLP